MNKMSLKNIRARQAKRQKKLGMIPEPLVDLVKPIEETPHVANCPSLEVDEKQKEISTKATKAIKKKAFMAPTGEELDAANGKGE